MKTKSTHSKHRTSKQPHKAKSRFSLLGLSILGLFLSISVLILLAITVQRPTPEPDADASGCGTLQVGVSLTNGTTGTYTNAISVPDNVLHYYLKANSANGQPCSTQLKARSRLCTENNQCGAWSEQLWQDPAWGVYHTNAQGIARVDYSPGLPRGRYEASFKPVNSPNANWSNTISVTLAPGRQDQQSLDFSEYLQLEPGNLWEYEGKNNIFNTTGTAWIQAEAERSICGLSTIPLRFTKSHPDIYWGTRRNGGPYNRRDLVLRWFIAKKNAAPSSLPSYQGFAWGLGDSRYTRTSDKTDIVPAADTHHSIYQATGGLLPAYNLGLWTAYDGYTSVNNAWYYGTLPTFAGCGQNSFITQTAPNHVWKIRVKKMTLPHPVTQAQTDNLRVDYYESPNGGGMTRESWYFMKNVGLVEIKVKDFDGYAGQCRTNQPNCARPCAQDPDCLADEIANPIATLKLRSFSKTSSAITVAVSSPATPNNYQSQITVSRSQGYNLKVTQPSNTPYTGYLEAQVGNSVIKWLWVTNGMIFVTPEQLAGLAPGNYPARFRTWTPKEAFPGETNVRQVNQPWSNQITVTLTP